MDSALLDQRAKLVFLNTVFVGGTAVHHINTPWM